MADDQLAFDLDLPAVPERPARKKRSAPRQAEGTPASPRRAERAAAPTSGTLWEESGLGRPAPPPPQPFHYTRAMGEVVRDVVATLEELRHVDLDRVLLSIAQARQSSKHGVYASCVPLRFEGGAQETRVGKHRYRMPPVMHEGREILYILYFMLPRFHEEQDYHEKLATVIHELYHISPEFNGDIRRFPGKNFAHGQSREVYHGAMRKLADRYLALSQRGQSHEFLKQPFTELLQHPGGVVGTSITRPRAVLVAPPGPGRK